MKSIHNPIHKNIKHEWRKEEKEIYLPKNSPQLLTIPKFHYFMLSGKGNPNNQGYADDIGVLYSLSYAIKMRPKNGVTPEGYFDYTVYPLEGIWDLAEEARHLDYLDKDHFIYTIMIRQPDFVTNELANQVLSEVKLKKPHVLLDEVRFESVEEGLCVQMLHIGSYDEEPKSFSIMEEYCTNHQLKRISKIHKEIYLSDYRKTEESKLKTILRFQVKEEQ